MARISKEEQEVVKKRILNVSRKLFNEVGFDKTSTKMIAKETGIAEGTIFNYFGSKDELFFEGFYEENMEIIDKGIYVKGDGSNVIEDLCENIFNAINRMLKFPKKVLIQMGLVSIKIARKRPELFKKMAKMDFKYMEEISRYLEEVIKKGLFKEFDSDKMSEIIYGIIFYEFTLYLYDKELSRDELRFKIKDKINILLSGYLKEEK